MSAVADSLRIPVDSQVDGKGNGAIPDLQTRVLQIIGQKGYFRHVTEQSLLSEDDSDDSKTKSEQLQDQDHEEDETAQRRQEKLRQGREEMFQQLNRAQNDILVALEVVSFLLSKHSTSAQSTMSEDLKKRVPVGSLESRVVQPRPRSEAKALQHDLTSQGWRSKAFGSVSQRFSSASNRLGVESEREAKYWAHIAKLRHRGIPVSRDCRPVGNNKAIGVHFGAADSATQFQNRGFAQLRQDADSNVYIDRGTTPQHQKRMRVEISRGQVKTGSYSFGAIAINDTEANHSFVEARDELFEDELFFEVCREARVMANQGINTRGETVNFSIGDEYVVSLSFKPFALELESSSREDDPLAEYVGLSLRGLLQQAHRNNFLRRSSTPPPLLSKPTSIPEYAILRPLVASLRHGVAVWEAQAIVTKALLEPLRRAGLDIDLQSTSTEDSDFENDSGFDHSIVSNRACRSRFSLVLPTQKQIRITITTHLWAPVYGTRYELSALEYDFAQIGDSAYQNIDALLDALLAASKLDLVAFVASVKSNNLKSANSQNDVKSKNTWKVSRPHNGELTLMSENSGKQVASMRVDIDDALLVLRLAPAKPDYQSAKKILVWAWSHHGASHAPSLTGKPEDVGIDMSIAKRSSFSEVVERSLELGD